LVDPRVSKEIDYEALHHYLSLLVIPAPWSIFQSIRKLPAGHRMLVDKRGVQIDSYWPCEERPPEVSIPESDAIEEIRRLLFRAV
jgi:asparagine synthase (glutamine-hydrolysing)